MDATKRFWSYVDTRGGLEACWPWLGTDNAQGYGVIRIEGKNILAHVYAWELKHGPTPPGMFRDHLCRNRRCCNVRHMELVSRGENVRRGSRWDPGVCTRGHPKTLDNFDFRLKRCITCANELRRQRRRGER